MRDWINPPAHGDPNLDIWELAFQISSMQSLLRGFEQELQYKYEQQMNALDSLKRLSDFLMLMVNRIYDKRAGENNTPEGR